MFEERYSGRGRSGDGGGGREEVGRWWAKELGSTEKQRRWSSLRRCSDDSGMVGFRIFSVCERVAREGFGVLEVEG